MSATRQSATSLAGLVNGIEHCENFVRDLAAVILPQHEAFESVWDVTNRVYERSCNRMALQCGRPQPAAQLRLSA